MTRKGWILAFWVAGSLAAAGWADDMNSMTHEPATGDTNRELVTKTPAEKQKELDIKSQRERVRQAAEERDQAKTRYGPDSIATKDAQDRLDDEDRKLDELLYEHGKVPGPATPMTSNPALEAPSNQNAEPPPKQIKF